MEFWILGWWDALGGVKFGGVFVLNYDCGGGKMKCAVKKMVGDEGLAGKLTAVTTIAQVWVPQKAKKFEWWKVENMCQTGGIKKLEYFEWWVMSDGWWVMGDENWVMSDHFFKTKQAYNHFKEK